MKKDFNKLKVKKEKIKFKQSCRERPSKAECLWQRDHFHRQGIQKDFQMKAEVRMQKGEKLKKEKK